MSTPIGNLEDLTFRAARVLGEVDEVLAEDTRRAAILLNHFEIDVPVRSLNEHNEERRAGKVLEGLGAGRDFALVSDAGTPLVSDPGERLVARAWEAGHRVVPIPGPSAVLAALVASGLPAGTFAFLGFPPRKGSERREALARVADAQETVVLFEAPGRTAALLHDLARACGGERSAAVGRELTKVHEEIRRGTLAELAGYYREAPPKGEVTVLVGRRPAEAGADEALDEAAVGALAEPLLEAGGSPSRVAREVARRLGLPRNRVYPLVQTLSGARRQA